MEYFGMSEGTSSLAENGYKDDEKIVKGGAQQLERDEINAFRSWQHN